MSLLTVRNLSVKVRRTGQTLLRDVDLAIDRGSIVGLVGESGSGKSMLALTLMGLLPNAFQVVGGTAEVMGQPVFTGPSHTYVSSVRNEVALISQNPRAALNPTMRIGKQMVRVLCRRRGMDVDAARAESRELLKGVGISDVDRVMAAYPHQLSGGMCQRVVIAIALSTGASLLIADEPTTGLDVTIQAQILLLLRQLMAERDRSVLMVTHDLAVVSSLCDKVIVLYGGQVMEAGPTQEIFLNPKHPYTRFLLEGLPDRVSTASDIGDRVREAQVDFSLAGCRFATRCPFSTDECHTEPPGPALLDRQTVHCHNLVTVT